MVNLIKRNHNISSPTVYNPILTKTVTDGSLIDTSSYQAPTFRPTLTPMMNMVDSTIPSVLSGSAKKQ